MATPSQLVELIAKQAPEASAQGENVILTAPVTVPGRPGVPDQDGQVRLILTLEQATHLAAQIQPAVRIALVRSQQRN